MSNLTFVDTEVEFARITLQKKDGSGSVTYQLGTDYWASGTIYATNDPVYPVLARAPEVHRGMGGEFVATRYDFTLEIYAKADLDEYGRSFADLRDQYQFYNGAVELRYYPKPSGATITPSDNTRQVARVINVAYDEESGIMSLSCRDTWFTDKELNKRLTADVFTDVEAASEGEWGSMVFGEASTVADGIAIDAPVIASEIDVSNRPTAKLFTGWTYGSGHLNNALKKLYVRNPYPDIDARSYVPVNLVADPQTPVSGDATITAPADPPNWATDLSYYSRMKVYRPTSGAEILTTVRCALTANTVERCADFDDGEYFVPHHRNLLSNNESFTVEMWVYFDTLHDGGARRYWLQQGADGETIEWGFFFNTANDQPRFSIFNSPGGAGEKTCVWGSSLSTGTWYHMIGYYDADTDTMGLSVNNGAAVTLGTVGGIAVQDGSLYVGGESSPSLDGRLRCIRYWNRVLDSTARTSIYNSGEGKTTDKLSEAEKVDLDADWPLSEPYGNRQEYRAGSPLRPRVGDILYNYSTHDTNIDNSYGECSLTVYRVETKDSGDSFNPVGGPLGKTTIDITTPAIQSGTTDAYFQFDPPLVLLDGIDYGFVLEWSNHRTYSYFVKCRYASGSGYSYALDTRQESQNWTKQAGIELGMALYVVGYGDDAWEDGTVLGSNDYSYLHLESKAITLSTGQSHLEFAPKLSFKVGLSGLEDDGGGAYTGAAHALIRYPSDILRFLLGDASFGVNVSSLIDSSSFTDTRGNQTTAGLTMGLALRGPISAESFVVELCRQGRMRMYKKPDGKLALSFANPANSIDFMISEIVLRDEMEMLALADSPDGSLVNEFKQSFAVDILESKKDIALVRASMTDKYSGYRQITATTSTDSDAAKQALCAASQALYGVKEMREPLDYYDADAPAKHIQDHWCERYSSKQRRAVVRLPRSRYYLSSSGIALFSKVRIEHSGIEAVDGTRCSYRTDDGAGTPENIYDSEGVPGFAWSGGVITGEVVDIVESGPYMSITVQGLPHFGEV